MKVYAIEHHGNEHGFVSVIFSTLDKAEAHMRSKVKDYKGINYCYDDPDNNGGISIEEYELDKIEM